MASVDGFLAHAIAIGTQISEHIRGTIILFINKDINFYSKKAPC